MPHRVDNNAGMERVFDKGPAINFLVDYINALTIKPDYRFIKPLLDDVARQQPEPKPIFDGLTFTGPIEPPTAHAERAVDFFYARRDKAARAHLLCAAAIILPLVASGHLAFMVFAGFVAVNAGVMCGLSRVKGFYHAIVEHNLQIR